jgi:hypothetical protein
MAIPVTVTARPPYPRVQAHARHRRRTPGRCSNHSATAERIGKERRSACSCAPYQPSSAPPSKPIRRRHHHLPPSYPRTATVRVRGRSSWPDRSEDRPDGRPLYGIARRAPPRSWIARRACNSPPPWPIKGEASPQPRGDELSSRQHTVHSLSYSPTISSATPPGTWKPRFLSRLACICPTTSTPGAEQYSATSTTLLDVRPPRPEPG